MKQITAYKATSGRVFETEKEALVDDVESKEENEFDELLIKADFPENYNSNFDNWDCKESPVEKCVYDSKEYWGEECCVFCGEPEERK